MQAKESREDYLEAILILRLEKDKVREVDVSRFLNYSKPSVSIAMKKLIKEGWVEIDETHHLQLTRTGYIIASKTYEKHLNIARFLERIGVTYSVALKDACKMEHDISEETFQKMKDFFKK